MRNFDEKNVQVIKFQGREFLQIEEGKAMCWNEYCAAFISWTPGKFEETIFLTIDPYACFFCVQQYDEIQRDMIEA